MATLTVTSVTRSGVLDIDSTAVAADAGLSDKFINDGKVLFYINNGGGGSITVTLVFSPTALIDGQAPTNRTITVVNGKRALVGPFPQSTYNDSSGYMNIQYSAVTSVKVLAFENGT